jgi:hypothetical protein
VVQVEGGCLSDELTAKSVLDYAARLRTQAQAIVAGDPYAEPYRPSEAAAKRLCQLKVKERLLALEADHTPEEADRARSRGCEDALQELRWRSGHADRVRREQLVQDGYAEKRMKRIQEEARQEAQALRHMLTVGQRVDDAIAKLSVVASGPGVNWDPKITGTREAQSPRFHGDPAERARSRALRLVKELERDVEQAQRREYAA